MTSINFIICKQDAECLLDGLTGSLVPSQHKRRDTLIAQLRHMLKGGDPKPNGWAPGFDKGRIRSSWPTYVKRTSKRDPYFHKPRDKKQVEKAVQHIKTAAEILAELQSKP
jgi:hypothetical protein